MERIYPRKCRYVGDGPLRALIARGEDLARTHGLTSERGVAVFTALIFVMGHLGLLKLGARIVRRPLPDRTGSPFVPGETN